MAACKHGEGLLIRAHYCKGCSISALSHNRASTSDTLVMCSVTLLASDMIPTPMACIRWGLEHRVKTLPERLHESAVSQIIWWSINHNYYTLGNLALEPFPGTSLEPQLDLRDSGAKSRTSQKADLHPNELAAHFRRQEIGNVAVLDIKASNTARVTLSTQ